MILAGRGHTPEQAKDNNKSKIWRGGARTFVRVGGTHTGLVARAKSPHKNNQQEAGATGKLNWNQEVRKQAQTQPQNIQNAAHDLRSKKRQKKQKQPNQHAQRHKNLTINLSHEENKEKPPKN